MDASPNRAPSGLKNLHGKLLWLGLFTAGAALRALGIANTSPTSVLNMPLPDDAFYYFTLARNLAAGRGPVISGDGVLTTGFQPLWGFTLGGANALLGGLEPLSLILLAQVLGAAIGLGTAVLLLRYSRQIGAGDGAQLLIVGAYLLSPQVIKHNLNGLETGLAFAGLLALGLLFLRADRWLESRRSSLLAGLIGGLAVLARVDLVIFAASAGVIMFFRSWTRADMRSRRTLLANAIVYGLGMMLPLAPWLIFSLRTTGGIIPESGQAVRQLTLLVRHLPFLGPIPSLLQAPGTFLPYYLDNAAEFTSAWVRQIPVMLPLTIPFYALIGIERATTLSPLLAVPVVGLAAWLLRRLKSPVAALALAHWTLFALLMTVAYAIFIQGPWFYQRYAAPLSVMLNALLVSAVARSLPSIKWRPVAGGIATAAIAASYVVLLWKGSYTWIVRGAQAVPQDGWFQAAQTLANRYPPDARVGVFSAGLIGYYAPQPVLALDGKVNQHAAQALAQGNMLDFLCRSEVEYVVDWPKMVRSLVERRSQGWEPDALQEVDRVVYPGMNDVVIYRLNRASCPSPNEGLNSSR